VSCVVCVRACVCDVVCVCVCVCVCGVACRVSCHKPTSGVEHDVAAVAGVEQVVLVQDITADEVDLHDQARPAKTKAQRHTKVSGDSLVAFVMRRVRVRVRCVRVRCVRVRWCV
jgi:hypothetical protein